MGSGNKALEQIEVNTRSTAASVSVGGDLYEKMDQLVKALEKPTTSGGKVSIKEAMVLRVTAGALEPIGLGLGIIIDSLNRAPKGKKLKEKMEALTNGLLSLADIGYSILKFAATMILATPLLLVAGAAALIWVPLLRGMIWGLTWATEKLDDKALKKITVLGDVGMALLIVSGSLALMGLMAVPIAKGLVVAGGVLLGFGLIGTLIDKLKLGEGMKKLSKTLITLSYALLGLSVGLVLMGLLAKPVLAGLAVASLVVLTLAGTFYLIDKLQIDKSMRKTSRALIMASGAILSVSLALVLSSLIISSLGLAEIGKSLLLVGLVAGTFYLLDKLQIDKSMRKTSLALIFAAGAILAVTTAIVLSSLIVSAIGLVEIGKVLLLVGAVALTFFVVDKIMSKGGKKGALALIFAAGAILTIAVSIFLANMLIGPIDTENILKTFAVLAVIAAVGLVFTAAGLASSFIKKGAIAMAFAGGSLIAVAVGVYSMKKAIKGLSWENVGMIGAIVGGLAIVMGIAGAGPLPVFIALGSAAMIVAGIALLTIGAGVNLFGNAIKDLSWENVGMMGAIVVGLALAMGVAGLAAPFILMGSAAMIVSGVALLAIAPGVKLFGSAVENLTTDKVLLMGGIIVGLAASMAVAGLAAPLILIGSVAMIAAGTATILIGTALKSLSNIDFSTLGTLSEKGNKAFNWSGEKGFFGGKVSNLESMVNGIVDAVSINPISAAGIALGAPTLILAANAMILISKGIRSFTGILDDVNLPKLSGNVNLIASALADTFANIGMKYPGGGKSFLGALTGDTSGQSVVTQGISAVSGMGKALTGIAKGVQAMAMLKFPTGFDKNGNPTGYQTIDLTSAVPALIANTKLIVSGLSSVFAEVGSSSAAQGGSSWFSSSAYEKGIDVVKEMGTPLYNLANGVQSMADLKFPTGYDKDGNPTGYKTIGDVGTLVKKLAKNTKALIIGLAGVFEDVGKSGVGQDGGWFSASNFEKGAQIALSLADPYSSLAGAVESVSKITKGIKSASDVREKVSTMIDVITGSGEANVDLNAKKNLIWAIGGTYQKLGVSIPLIVRAITNFTVEKGKAFASIFGGETAPESFDIKSNMLKQLSKSYMQMAVAIPLIIGSINTVDAEQMDEFTKLYGGATNDTEVMAAKGSLFESAGTFYEKLGSNAPKLTSAIAGTNIEQMGAWKSMFIGDVSSFRPIAGYEAQANLWDSIGSSLDMGAGAFPKISAGINAIDYDKLVESRKMFEALGVLSEGGEPSDILAAMGQSLESALDNLASMLEEFKQTVGENGEESNGLIGKMVDTVKSITTGSNSNNSGGGSTVRMPSKMTVTLDQKSISAIKDSTSLGGGR
ncbi:hypothetical protein OAE73_00565 [bacterium]|nr:hypothetical protein [bacterium]